MILCGSGIRKRSRHFLGHGYPLIVVRLPRYAVSREFEQYYYCEQDHVVFSIRNLGRRYQLVIFVWLRLPESPWLSNRENYGVSEGLRVERELRPDISKAVCPGKEDNA